VYGIHVTGVYPGGVRTEFKQHTGADRKTGRTTPASLRLEPEEVARAVLNAVRRPKRTMIMPWQMRFVAWLNSHLPGVVDWVIENRFTRLERDI
jgi:short-subunit dehydrogenase